MIYRILADIIVIIHMSFILFVVLGGLLVVKYRRVVYIHFPAMIWGAIVEFYNIICPLTPWENYFREMGGVERYESDFIEKYLIPVMYPINLNVKIQFVLGCFVLVVNAIVYAVVLYHYFKKKKHETRFTRPDQQAPD